jgi:hypothetical protein
MKISFGFTLVIRRQRLSGGLKFFQARTRWDFPLASREHTDPSLPPEGRGRNKSCAVLFRLFKKQRGRAGGVHEIKGVCRFAAAGTRVALRNKK